MATAAAPNHKNRRNGASAFDQERESFLKKRLTIKGSEFFDFSALKKHCLDLVRKEHRLFVGKGNIGKKNRH